MNRTMSGMLSTDGALIDAYKDDGHGWYCVQHKVTFSRRLRTHANCQLQPVKEKVPTTIAAAADADDDDSTGIRQMQNITSVDDSTDKRRKRKIKHSDVDSLAAGPSTSCEGGIGKIEKHGLNESQKTESHRAARHKVLKDTHTDTEDSYETKCTLVDEEKNESNESMPMEAAVSQNSGFIAKSLHTLTVEDSSVVGVGTNTIRGSAVLPSGQFALADGNNHRILLETRNTLRFSTLKLRGDPFDIAVSGDTELLVSVPLQRRLRYVNITATGTMQLGRTIPLKMYCYGIAVHNNEIYVCVHMVLWKWDRGEVWVIDGGGRVLRRIGVDASGKHIFPTPLYVAVSATGSVFVTGGLSTVRLDSGGNVIFHITHEMKDAPRGMVLDRDDNLLVCTSADEVVMVSNDGTICKTFLTKTDGVDHPQSLAYRNTDDTLILTMYTNNIVCRAYKLKVQSTETT